MFVRGVYLGKEPKSFTTKAGVKVNQMMVAIKEPGRLKPWMGTLPENWVAPAEMSQVEGAITDLRFNPFDKTVELILSSLSAVPAMPESAGKVK